MASIGCNTTFNSVELYLYNLDENWILSDGQRYVDWYIGHPNGDIPTFDSYYKRKLDVEIKEKTTKPGASEGAHCVFEDLEADTKYGVLCELFYDKSDGTGRHYITAFEGKVQTDSKPNWQLADLGSLKMSPNGNNYHSDTLYSVKGLMYRLNVVFESDCTVDFYSDCSMDTCGYLGMVSTFDDDKGVPYLYSVYDDESGYDNNFFITFDVKKDINYYFWFRAYSDDDDGDIVFHISCYKTPIIARWNWGNSNGSASETQTEVSYDAILYRQPTTNFHHKVWNDMVDKVKDILNAVNFGWDAEDYESYEDTKMYAEPYELKASMFNALRNNLEIAGLRALKLGYGTGLNQVHQGDDVLGWYFTKLTEYMNECIDVINSS